MSATNVYDCVQAITIARIKTDMQCTDGGYTPIFGAKLCNPMSRSRLAKRECLAGKEWHLMSEDKLLSTPPSPHSDGSHADSCTDPNKLSSIVSVGFIFG